MCLSLCRRLTVASITSEIDAMRLRRHIFGLIDMMDVSRVIRWKFAIPIHHSGIIRIGRACVRAVIVIRIRL